jgi:hypothetical protein
MEEEKIAKHRVRLPEALAEPHHDLVRLAHLETAQRTAPITENRTEADGAHLNPAALEVRQGKSDDGPGRLEELFLATTLRGHGDRTPLPANISNHRLKSDFARFRQALLQQVSCLAGAFR